MSKAIKIAISLPPELLEAADQKRQDRGETRSEFFRHAVEALLRREQEQEAVQRYLQGYRVQPETDEEVEAMHRASSHISLDTAGVNGCTREFLTVVNQ